MLPRRALAALVPTLLLLASPAVAVLATKAPIAADLRTSSPEGEGAREAPIALRVLREPGGRIPTAEEASLRLERKSAILVRSDDEWTPANGVRGGSGTPEDPYVISGYNADTVLIADTTRCYEITGNWISGILVLDWTGPCGLVHANHVGNLRTNRNVARTGDPTAAVVAKNEITRVEELRHFDGTLADNAIGVKRGIAGVAVGGNPVVLNIAGLNGADIARNVIHGGVDMKLHGHHHSDATGAHSHNHGKPDAAQMEGREEQHGVRHVNFLFRDNRIVDTGFGLRYNDLNHAGDDRTATSEEEPTLENPHVHYTTVTIANNVIEGRGLRVSAFNAPDERHLAGQVGRIVLEGNRIVKPVAGDAVLVQDVADAVVVVRGNVVEKATTDAGDVPRTIRALAATVGFDSGSGVMLHRFTNATVVVADNALPGYRYGVRAAEMDARTVWFVADNRAPDAKYPVYWDASVANEPRDGAPSGEHAHDDDGHDH